MTGITTRLYRKSRLMENTINQNKDLLWYAVSLFCSFLFGVICSVLFIWLLLYFKWADIDTLGISVTKIATFIVSLGTAIWAVIAKLHAPTGEISKGLQASGNKPLEQIASNGLSVTSTLFKGSQDVYFEQQTSENKGINANSQ